MQKNKLESSHAIPESFDVACHELQVVPTQRALEPPATHPLAWQSASCKDAALLMVNPSILKEFLHQAVLLCCAPVVPIDFLLPILSEFLPQAVPLCCVPSGIRQSVRLLLQQQLQLLQLQLSGRPVLQQQLSLQLGGLIQYYQSSQKRCQRLSCRSVSPWTRNDNGAPYSMGYQAAQFPEEGMNRLMLDLA
jgi:hypothetical protein